MSETQIETKIEFTPNFTTTLVAVQKRGGETVPFNAIKIYNAIKRAVDVTTELSNEQIAAITQSVLDTLAAEYVQRAPSVETIQDTVIRKLMDNGAYKTAESYIIYRQKRTEIRESMVDAVDIIEGYVGGSNWRIKENANVGYSIGGLILRTSERVTAEYWLNLYPRAVAEAHKNAAIHVHDLGWLTGYCAGWSLRELLYEGFNGVPGYLHCEPARHMATAISHMVNFLGTLQNEFAGA
ncbi:MAG: ribonucleoside triphosphate reductase, partial [Alphaproteobacteria bacterium]|nr:ribonucleoside triphosphate reductase [Alphaproteobacteria bacterium]